MMKKTCTSLTEFDQKIIVRRKNFVKVSISANNDKILRFESSDGRHHGCESNQHTNGKHGVFLLEVSVHLMR